MKQVIASDMTSLAAALSHHRERYEAPACLSFNKVGKLVDRTLDILFPHFDGACNKPDVTSERLEELVEDYARAVSNLEGVGGMEPARQHVLQAFARLPELAERCHGDALSLLENDPAAASLDEVILCYPGFYAITVYRVARLFLQEGLPILPRMMTEYAHRKTGIEIHPNAKIGHNFSLDHGTGVVIGATAVIGDNVKIYQGVTLGALRVDRRERNIKRHPTIEDNVVIYANATILGGDTVVGKNSVIGGNVWITRSVPAGSRVMFRASDREDVVDLEARHQA